MDHSLALMIHADQSLAGVAGPSCCPTTGEGERNGSPSLGRIEQRIAIQTQSARMPTGLAASYPGISY
jgi:hypothetical protein